MERTLSEIVTEYEEKISNLESNAKKLNLLFEASELIDDILFNEPPLYIMIKDVVEVTNRVCCDENLLESAIMRSSHMTGFFKGEVVNMDTTKSGEISIHMRLTAHPSKLLAIDYKFIFVEYFNSLIIPHSITYYNDSGTVTRQICGSFSHSNVAKVFNINEFNCGIKNYDVIIEGLFEPLKKAICNYLSSIPKKKYN